MDQDPSEEFDHFLCEKLGWRSVAEMRRCMSASEWFAWKMYYARRAQERELAQLQASGG